MGLGPKAGVVAKQALLFEEFLAREARAGRFTVDFRPAPAPILLYGHCPQKAFGAVAPIMDVLKLIPGTAPELIDSSCCGKAGSFGCEGSNSDFSMQIDESAPLPALRTPHESRSYRARG